MTAIDRRIGVYLQAAIKLPCRVATTANITLDGLQTVDGVALASGDRVLVKNQTTASANGIYVADTGLWQRSRDFNGPHDAVEGSLVLVIDGTGGDTVYQLTTASPVIGTSNLTFAVTGAAALATASPYGLTLIAALNAAAARTVLDVYSKGETDTVAFAAAPLTTRGDLLTRDAAGIARLAIGVNERVLSSDGVDVSWQRRHDPGDFKWAFRSTEPAGWLFASGKTIGNASSNATARASADTEDLFVHLWGESTNSELQLFDSGGTPVTRGVSAAADYAANRKLALPSLRDRTAIGKGDMGGTDAGLIAGFDTTVLGKSGGEGEHVLTEAELPAHDHVLVTNNSGVGSSGFPTASTGGGAAVNTATQNAGSGNAHNNVQPSLVLNAFIKL